jgi:hypothetical protein
MDGDKGVLVKENRIARVKDENDHVSPA